VAKYWRFNKKEGSLPNRGPWIVIRSALETMDWSTEDLPFPERHRRIAIGWYWSEMFSFTFIVETRKRIYGWPNPIPVQLPYDYATTTAIKQRLVQEMNEDTVMEV